jgi:receptor protein-tyrosine kinase
MNPGPDQQQDLRIADYLRPILGRKWLILAIVVIVTGGTYLYYDQQPRQYTASTRIFVNTSPGADTTGAGQSVLPTTDRTTQNQATLLASREVAQRVAKRLKRSPDSVKGVTATPIAGSDFVTITAVRPSGAEAALFANAFAQEFLELRLAERRTSVQKALAAARQQLRDLPRTAANAPERAVAEGNVRRLQLALSLPTGDAEQLDPAIAPTVATSPKPTRNAIFAFFLSIIAAVGLAFGLERFDRRLKSVDDAEPAYGLPLLAVVPHSDAAAMLVDNRAALSPDCREGFRHLRTNLQLEGLNEPIRRILVTSALPREGKSTVVRNLALAFAESGQRVAVIDADLRRPTLTKLFATPTESGLTTVMTGADTIESSMVRVPIHAPGLETLAQIEATTTTMTGQPGTVINGDDQEGPSLGLLASGPAPANPQAVLAARRTAMVIKDISDHHDILLIDSPPLTVVSDALAIAPHVDAVVFVVRLGVTTKEGAKRAAELLKRVPSARAVGIVVNDLTGPDSDSYGYGYGYGYGNIDESKL